MWGYHPLVVSLANTSEVLSIVNRSDDRLSTRSRRRRRRKRAQVKERIVKKRQFENLKLVSEDVAEMEYRPVACRKTYRLIIVRKNLLRRDEQGELFPNYRYFFYLTNDRTATLAQIVFSANDRCDQENLNAQLKGGVSVR